MSADDNRLPPPEDSTKLLILANLVHELTHYWQHVARPFVIAAYSTFTLQAKYTLQFVRACSDRHSLPLSLRLPLLRLALESPPGTTIRKQWFSPWATLETAYCMIAGPGSSPAYALCADLFREFSGNVSLDHLPDPLLPAIDRFDRRPVTMRLLLENEAFANEFELIESLYGIEVATDVARTLYGEQIPLEYGGLYFRFPGRHYFALATDRAFLDRPGRTTNRQQWCTMHPSWRFQRVVKTLESAPALWRDPSRLVVDYQDVRKHIEGIAQLGSALDLVGDTMEWISRSEDAFFPEMRRLFLHALSLRLVHRDCFAFPLAFFWTILRELPVPLVSFRGRKGICGSFGPAVSNFRRLAEELWLLTSARELALGERLRCPVCSFGATGDRENENERPSCTGACSWATWFEETWGRNPLQFIEPATA